MPEVLQVRRIENGGNLKGVASVRVGSVTIHDFRIVQEPNKAAYVQPPQRSYTDKQSGRQQFAGPLVELPADVLARVKKAVLVAWAEETGKFHQI